MLGACTTCMACTHSSESCNRWAAQSWQHCWRQAAGGVPEGMIVVGAQVQAAQAAGAPLGVHQRQRHAAAAVEQRDMDMSVLA